MRGGDNKNSQTGKSILSKDSLFLRKVLNSMVCGLYVYDAEQGRNELINSEYTRITGWTLDEINAMSSDEFAQLFHPEDQAKVFAHMTTLLTSEAQSEEIEYRFKTKGGQWIWCLSRDTVLRDSTSAKATHFVGTFLDITARKEQNQLELDQKRRLHDMQKMESLGLLAGRVAHDFNNFLMAIGANLELIQMKVGKNSDVSANVERASLAIREGSRVVDQLRSYAGGTTFDTSLLGLSDLVQETSSLLYALFSKDCQLRLHLQPGLPRVRANATQIRQVILNLLMNAADAIGETDGHIALRTGVVDCSSAMLDGEYNAPQLPEGRYVFLDVEDSGAGISSTEMPKIFDPFFSTKDLGNGLGLSTVLGIVRGHSGAVRCESEVGKGSTFRILLPIGARNLSVVEARNEGSKTILIADDDETILEAISEYLEASDFAVLAASNGLECVDLYREHVGAIDLVLLDISMPVLGGGETLRILREISPAVQVILMSGYTEQSAQRLVDVKGLHFFKKPFQLAELRQAITDCLASSKGQVFSR
jgi:PAS domain S-box-containing protein